MTESITVTKEEIVELVENLISKKLPKVEEPKIKTNDIYSPHYNTNLLFNDYSKNLKVELKAIQEDKGMFTQCRWGKSYEIKEYDVHDRIRKLVLLSFGVTSANRLKIEERLLARELYLSVSNMFLKGLRNKR